MATSGHKSISRIDSRNTHGWYVRVKFNRQNHTKFFTDNVHGGKSSALDAAIRWRDQKECELGKPRTDRIVIASFPGNNTGYSGVIRTKKWTGAKDKDSNPLPNYADVYSVTWSPEPGIARQTSFSVEKFGEEEARRRAIDLRKRMERQIYGQEIKVRSPKRNSRKQKTIPSHQNQQNSQASSRSNQAKLAR